jgi:hypothetical protein
MSRHRIPASSTGGGKLSLFGRIELGAPLATCEAVPPRWGAHAWKLAGILAIALSSACLVTDQIELPPVPQSPPVITLTRYDDPQAVIKFDRDKFNELTVDLSIRDEDVTETLEARWRIVSLVHPPGVPENQFPCPEPEIVGKGTLTRSHPLRLQGSSFASGKCSRVDVIVSASFKNCKPEDWANTTQQDDDSDVGRLSFWVWAYDATTNPLASPEAALALITSCPTADFRPPSATASATSAATGQ